MKIGFFLGYGPQTILHKEGLGRYIGSLIKGAVDNGEDVVLAYPEWLRATVEELLNEFSVPPGSIHEVHQNTPPLWKVYDRFYLHPKKRKRFLPQLHMLFNAALSRLVNQLVRDRTTFSFIGHLLLGALAFLVLLIPALVFVLLFCAVKIIYKIVKFLALDKLDLFGRIQNTMQSIVIEADSGSSDLWLDGFNTMLSNTLQGLVETVNRSEKVSCWYVPGLFWPEAAELSGCKVFCAPDLVTREYAIGFSRDVTNTEHSTLQCVETLQKGKYFITYCDYIKQSLLIDQFAKPEAHVAVIRHSNNDLSGCIRLDTEGLNKTCRSSRDFTEAYCRQLSGLGDIRYLFYASQFRPHKNILNLLTAYEYLLKSQKISCKLVLTGNVKALGTVKDFVEEHKLDKEVIFCYNVSMQKLAALYACADLTVNPTLYEGGFPFTFGEGMSVGTPSIMSRIPQTQDILEPAGLEEVLFDPYNWRDLAEKIAYWLPRTEELYQKELPLYREQEKRTPDVAAKDYIQAFEYFIRLEEAGSPAD